MTSQPPDELPLNSNACRKHQDVEVYGEYGQRGCFDCADCVWAAKVAAAYQATVQHDSNVSNTCSTSGQLNMSQPDSDLRLQIAEDLISLPIGKNKPLFWDLDTLVDYIAIAQTKLVEELLGDLPDMKEVVTPIKPGINGYNLALAEVTALLKAKLTKG